MSVDPFAVFDPIMHEEFYFDGEHNSGIYNHFNHNPYIYVYQNPIKLLDPNGKQVESEYLGRFSTNSSFANGFIDGAINSIAWISGAKMTIQLTTDPNFRKQFMDAIKKIAENPKEFLMSVAKDKVEAYTAFFNGKATEQQMYDIGGDFAGYTLGLILGGGLLKLVNNLKKDGVKATVDVAKDKAKKAIQKLCFVAGTLILTEKGFKPIEEIQVGEKVWSYNEVTKETELKEVVALSRNTTSQLIEIKAGNETIVCTPEHPFYIGDKWIEAKNLNIGDQLTLKNNTFVKISKLNPLEKEVTVYNFEVADNHNYYVSELEVLVHNDCFGFNIKKAVNSNMPHAVERGLERGVFENAVEAKKVLNETSDYITKNKTFPEGSIKDPSYSDRVLVPVGKDGMAAYQVGNNGTVKLKTVLIKK